VIYDDDRLRGIIGSDVICGHAVEYHKILKARCPYCGGKMRTTSTMRVEGHIVRYHKCVVKACPGCNLSHKSATLDESERKTEK